MHATSVACACQLILRQRASVSCADAEGSGMKKAKHFLSLGISGVILVFKAFSLSRIYSLKK